MDFTSYISLLNSSVRIIKGVGEKTEQRLLLRFGSVARIAATPVDEIAELIGRQLAERRLETLNNK